MHEETLEHKKPALRLYPHLSGSRSRSATYIAQMQGSSFAIWRGVQGKVEAARGRMRCERRACVCRNNGLVHMKG